MLPVRPARLAVVALILMSLIWGYNWVVMKQVIRYVDPFDFSAIRTLLAAVALFIVVVIARRPLRPVALSQLLLLGLMQTAAFTALIQWALVSGGAGKTAILVYTMPFWLIPLAWWLLGERVRGVQWVATAVAAVGLIFILDPWSMAGSAMGNVLAVTAGLAWALATVVAKRMRRDHDFDLLSMTAWQMLFGSLALCVVALLVPSRPIDPTPYFFGALIYNAVFATALAWLLWLYVLQNLPAGVAGLSALGIPLIGALSGWIELGERPSAGEFSGMALICLALALTSLWPLLQARRKA
ncbi:MAG: EamA family transporter [Azoarcus sp.]|jgi:drug/metabolite transporter (DMT)-like permease|nr:DMT family transporter [Azoarcus sp.]MDD2874619.1 EamA family transporter [Azoarcus sp.]MDX9839391.1 EamA family transporter [Azoarcus sp.]